MEYPRPIAQIQHKDEIVAMTLREAPQTGLLEERDIIDCLDIYVEGGMQMMFLQEKLRDGLRQNELRETIEII